MFINGVILTSLCKVYFLHPPPPPPPQKKKTQLGMIYNASVSSKCYHLPDDPRAFDQNFCLAQEEGILIKAGHLT